MTLVVCFLSFHYVLVYLLNFHYVLVYLLNYEFVDVWFLSQLYLKLGPGFNSILVPPLTRLTCKSCTFFLSLCLNIHPLASIFFPFLVPFNF